MGRSRKHAEGCRRLPEITQSRQYNRSQGRVKCAKFQREPVKRHNLVFGFRRRRRTLPTRHGAAISPSLTVLQPVRVPGFMAVRWLNLARRSLYPCGALTLRSLTPYITCNNSRLSNGTPQITVKPVDTLFYQLLRVHMPSVFLRLPLLKQRTKQDNPLSTCC